MTDCSEECSDDDALFEVNTAAADVGLSAIMAVLDKWRGGSSYDGQSRIKSLCR